MVAPKFQYSKSDGQLGFPPNAEPNPADRVIGIVYQNLTGRPIMIIVTLQLSITGIQTSISSLNIEAFNPPFDAHDRVALGTDTANGNIFGNQILIGVVPPNFFYQIVNDVAPVPNIVNWREIPL